MPAIRSLDPLKSDFLQDIYCNRVPVTVFSSSSPSSCCALPLETIGDYENSCMPKAVVESHNLKCSTYAYVCYFVRLPTGNVLALNNTCLRRA